MRFILRWLIGALTLLLLTHIVTGFHVTNFYAALVAALVIGLLNAIVRPVLILLTLPVNIITLGLFTFVINAALIWFTSTIVKGFDVTGFWPAVIAALVLWAVSTLTNWILHKDRNE